MKQFVNLRPCTGLLCNKPTLPTALVLVCRVSGIPQRQIKYSWTCPDGPCERPGYVGRKVVNGSILAVNITSVSDRGTYTCKVSRDEADGGYSQNYTLDVSGQYTQQTCTENKW